MSNKFLKAPLSQREKEKKAEDFLNFYDSGNSNNEEKKEKLPERILKKEPTKRITVRLPQSLADDLTEISAITGISVNSALIELLRNNVKQKLKDLKS